MYTHNRHLLRHISGQIIMDILLARFPVSLKIHGQRFWEGVFQTVQTYSLLGVMWHVEAMGSLHINLNQNWTGFSYHTFYLSQMSDELEESIRLVFQF